MLPTGPRIGARWLLAGAALLAGSLFTGALAVASTPAAAASTMAIAPAATGILALGDTFTVAVTVDATEAVSGAEATVTFDPAVVQLRAFARGAAWAQAPLWITGNDVAKANQAGALQGVAAAFFPPDAVAAGQSDFLILTFQAVACGSSWLGLPAGAPVNAQLLGGTAADYGALLPVTTSGGTATACPGSTPAPSPRPTPTPTPRPTPLPTPAPTPTPLPTPAPTPLPVAKGWTVRDLGTLGGWSSGAVAVNASGEVAGTSTRPDGATHAFLWRRGRMTDLGSLGGWYSGALAINDRGQVLGSSLTPRGTMHGFLWTRGRMVDLGASLGAPLSGGGGLAVNGHGIVVGNAATTGQAVVWIKGVAAALPTLGAGCQTRAISGRDVIVGTCYTSSGMPHAVVWTRH